MADPRDPAQNSSDDENPDEPDGTPSASNPFDLGAQNPFAAMPMFGDMMKAMQSQGPLNWDAARQFALLGATGGATEPNIDPTVRISFVELARVAGLHVNDVTGSDITFPEPRIITRGQWAHETLDAYRPLFNDLAQSLAQPAGSSSEAVAQPADSDPMAQMMAGLSRMVAPATLGMSIGSMVGALARRVFGIHDLPIPRDKQEIVLIGTTIDEFAREWEIPTDSMRLWVLAHELSGFLLFENKSLRDDLATMVRRHAAGFRPDPNALLGRIGDLDLDVNSDPFASITKLFSDPAALMGAVESPEQRSHLPQLDAAVAAVVGYTDWVVDAVAARLIGGEALRIAEAVRRQRQDVVDDDVFVERLLGIRVGADQVARGKAFVQGIVDRVGEDRLSELFALPNPLPTPNEIEAPGLWIARVTGE